MQAKKVTTPIIIVPDYIHNNNYTKYRRYHAKNKVKKPARMELVEDEDDWDGVPIIKPDIVEEPPAVIIDEHIYVEELKRFSDEVLNDKFWKLIDGCGWKDAIDRTFTAESYHNMKAFLSSQPPIDKILFKIKYQAYMEEIKNRLIGFLDDKSEEDRVGIYTHFIAMGKMAFMTILEDPTLILYFVNSGDIRSDFDDWVPGNMK